MKKIAGALLGRYKKSKDKLSFAVFIYPNSNIGENEDYKQVFTYIISDRIEEIKENLSYSKFPNNLRKRGIKWDKIMN